MDPQQMSEVTEIIQGPGTPEEKRRQVGEILRGGPVSAEASCTFKGELNASYSSSLLTVNFHVRLTAPADGKVKGYSLFFQTPDRIISWFSFTNYRDEDLREVKGFQFFEIDPKELPDVVEVMLQVYTKDCDHVFREKVPIR